MNRIALLFLAGIVSACATENLSSEDIAVTPSPATTPQDASLMQAMDVVGTATGGNNYLPDGEIERAIAESLDAHGLLVPQGWFSKTPARYNLALNIANFRIADGFVRFDGKYLLIDTTGSRIGPAWTTLVDASEPIGNGEEASSATERALHRSLEQMLNRLHEKPPLA
jgi:hypothetical protein